MTGLRWERHISLFLLAFAAIQLLRGQGIGEAASIALIGVALSILAAQRTLTELVALIADEQLRRDHTDAPTAGRS